jgi:predicted RNA-binding Zn-ribbon protein involved in translation (DUF1610 family)
MIEGEALCQSCRDRSDVGEFKAGLRRMMDGLERTGSHTTAAKAPAEYTYFKCRECGEEWIFAEDSSVRGSSRNLSRRRVRSQAPLTSEPVDGTNRVSDQV